MASHGEALPFVGGDLRQTLVAGKLASVVIERLGQIQLALDRQAMAAADPNNAADRCEQTGQPF